MTENKSEILGDDGKTASKSGGTVKKLPELFTAQSFAYELADLLVVLFLRRQGGIPRYDGRLKIEEAVVKRRNQGLTLSMIADSINSLFSDSKHDVELSLPNLYPILKRVCADNEGWVIKVNESKSYFFASDCDPEGRVFEEALMELRSTLMTVCKFIDSEVSPEKRIYPQFAQRDER